ncbi:MAG: hypothetical protein ACOX8R_01425 [Bacillota bacterium]|jgi:hypothetical protein
MTGLFEKIRRKFPAAESALLFCGCGLVRLMIIASILLLLLYSLVLHHFVIIFVLLLQVLALIGTFSE